MSSSALPTSVKASTTRTTQVAGGAMYHHAPRPGAPAAWAALRSWPHDGANGSPRPMNASVVSVRIAPAKIEHGVGDDEVRSRWAGCAAHDVRAAAPMTRARSTNIRSFTDSVCDRMIRAVDAQLVMPMTMTMTTSVVRMPKISASSPMMSRMIGARMMASTNVGRTRKKSVTRMRRVVGPAADEARRRCRSATPTKTVMSVASRPMTIETRAPWTVRLRMSRPSSSVPKMCAALGGSKRVAGGRGRPSRAGRRTAAGRWPGSAKKIEDRPARGRPSRRRDEPAPERRAARDAQAPARRLERRRRPSPTAHVRTRGSRRP